MELLSRVLIANGLLFAFVIVGVVMWFSYFASQELTRGRLHGSAVAIFLGLVLAYFGGAFTGGSSQDNGRWSGFVLAKLSWPPIRAERSK